jgi:uncharacterized protein (TIGR02996 family)
MVKAKLPTSAKSAALWEQYWQKPSDELLRVYADALEQEGDPRGQFIQLSLAGDTAKDQCGVYQRKHGGELVGPAKWLLREVEFAENGLVEKARTELPKLVSGVGEINQLSPRLILTLTSIKTLKDAQALGAVSAAALGRIYMIDFGMITGSFGGCQLNDKQLAAIAPAFAEVEHLQLSCRGAEGKAFSPKGLRAFGKHATKLRYLSVDYYDAGQGAAADYAPVIVEAFPALRALEFPGLTAAHLGGRKLQVNQLANLNFEHRNGLADKIEKLLA